MKNLYFSPLWQSSVLGVTEWRKILLSVQITYKFYQKGESEPKLPNFPNSAPLTENVSGLQSWLKMLTDNMNNFRRRTLKNRGYAASCRIKRLEQKDELESEKGKEFEDLDKMQVEIQVTAFRFYRIKYYGTLTTRQTLKEK